MISNGSKNGEQGQGWLFTRNGVCFVVTAGHIVKDMDEFRATIPLPGGGKYERPAKVCARFKKFDLALLSIAKVPPEECGGIFAVGITDESLIRTGIPAFLRTVQAESGGVKATDLHVVYEPGQDQAHFGVRGDNLRQGFSGAMVYGYGSPEEKEHPLGLFLAILDKDATLGKVLRRHTAFLSISELFNGNNQDVDRVDPACFESRQQEPVKSTVGENIASASCGAAIFETPLSDGKEHSSSLLIAPTEEGGYWQAKQSDQNCIQSTINRCPLWIEIDLCGGDSLRSIREVRLSGKNIPDKFLLPTDVRMWAQRSINETQVIGSGRVSADSATLTVINNNPRLARRLLLEIYPERNDFPVALERVEVYE